MIAWLLGWLFLSMAVHCSACCNHFMDCLLSLHLMHLFVLLLLRVFDMFFFIVQLCVCARAYLNSDTNKQITRAAKFNQNFI